MLHVYTYLDLGQSRNKGKHAVETILALQKSLESYQKLIRNLESQLLTAGLHSSDSGNPALELEDARAQHELISHSLQRKNAALGVSEQAALRKLINSDFLRIRMNAHALKMKLQDRLHQRKFEVELLERSYRHTSNSVFTFILPDLPVDNTIFRL
jgi:hypothetical protein